MTTYVIDANLVVLLAIGSYDIGLAGGRHKRCREFDARDYTILDDLLTGADSVVCTPHAMAEASNLIRQIGEPLRLKLTVHFGLLTSGFREAYATSGEAATDDAYPRLGLTDASLLVVSMDLDILTTDLDLYLAALQRGQRATNFTHLRESIAPY